MECHYHRVVAWLSGTSFVSLMKLLYVELG